MTDRNNAPERIWFRVTDKTVMERKPSDADEYDVEYIRAGRAAPERQVPEQCLVCRGKSFAKIDGEQARWRCVECKMVTPQPACQQEADLAAARAENERLTKELEHMTAIKDIHQRKRHEYFERAEKAEAERDEARASLRHMEGFERCTCGPCAIHGSAKLADTEQ